MGNCPYLYQELTIVYLGHCRGTGKGQEPVGNREIDLHELLPFLGTPYVYMVPQDTRAFIYVRVYITIYLSLEVLSTN